MTVRATFLQIKLKKGKIEGEMHPDIKIQVSCDMKQSTLGSILHPLTEARGRKFCSNGQQPEFVGRLSILSPDKTLEKQIRGTNASNYQNSGKL